MKNEHNIYLKVIKFTDVDKVLFTSNAGIFIIYHDHPFNSRLRITITVFFNRFYNKLVRGNATQLIFTFLLSQSIIQSIIFAGLG